jgi:hypothetical protein
MDREHLCGPRGFHGKLDPTLLKAVARLCDFDLGDRELRRQRLYYRRLFRADHQMLHALEHAAQRGVDVRLLLPSLSDAPLIVSAERSNYQALVDSGVKI